MQNLVPIVVTTSGILAVWERGGGHKNSGTSLCISDNFGKRKRALYTKTYAMKACKEHALLPIEEKDLVCSVKLWRNKETKLWQWHTRISEVIGFTTIEESLKAVVNTIEEFTTEQNSDKSYVSNKIFENLYNATLSKALEYHCRTPKFIR